MKKTRKQTALAKCVLATIMAMGMMGYTTVWAEDTVTPSPIDKSVSKDAAGHIMMLLIIMTRVTFGRI